MCWKTVGFADRNNVKKWTLYPGLSEGEEGLERSATLNPCDVWGPAIAQKYKVGYTRECAILKLKKIKNFLPREASRELIFPRASLAVAVDRPGCINVTVSTHFNRRSYAVSCVMQIHM